MQQLCISLQWKIFCEFIYKNNNNDLNFWLQIRESGLCIALDNHFFEFDLNGCSMQISVFQLNDFNHLFALIGFFCFYGFCWIEAKQTMPNKMDTHCQYNKFAGKQYFVASIRTTNTKNIFYCCILFHLYLMGKTQCSLFSVEMPIL